LNGKTVNILCYAFGIALFAPIVSLNFFAGGGWLDVHEYLFVPLIIGSLSFFSYSFLTLDSHPLLKVSLNVTISIAMMLGIPNLVWPLGSTWWDSISLAFGLMSVTLLTFNLMLFSLIYSHKLLIRKKANSAA
jgi:hypothetical protein